MNAEKKLCPMSFNVSPSAGVTYAVNQLCAEEGCAWWVIDKCSIPQIAVQFAVAAMELNEDGDSQ